MSSRLGNILHTTVLHKSSRFGKILHLNVFGGQFMLSNTRCICIKRLYQGEQLQRAIGYTVSNPRAANNWFRHTYRRSPQHGLEMKRFLRLPRIRAINAFILTTAVKINERLSAALPPQKSFH